MQLYFCENDSHVLTCGSWKINILSATYGRLTGAQVCGWGPIKTTYCKANGALAKVQAHCQGHSHCTLRATNSEFGDPCPGTYKYLEVTIFVSLALFSLVPKGSLFFFVIVKLSSSHKKNRRSRSLSNLFLFQWRGKRGAKRGKGEIEKPLTQNLRRSIFPPHLPSICSFHLLFFLTFPSHFSPFSIVKY